VSYIRSIRLLPALSLAALALAASCGDATGPEQRTSAELTFVKLAPDAPDILDVTASFYAVRGENRELRLRFAPLPGAVESEDYLRFEVDNESLDRRPDGSVIAEGDSVLITVHVVDLQKMIFEFQPSGLRFNANRPARLKVEFNHFDADLDGDGDIDATDTQLETRLALWKQENAGEPWVKLPTVLKFETNEAEAAITGFTGYALAF